jgi:hypothetical protein
MKKYKAIMTTTHVDLQGERMTIEALKSMVNGINKWYLPVNINHDIRCSPVGRVVSAQIIDLPDGEHAVEGIIETFDETDSFDSLAGDGRRMRVDIGDIEKFIVHYDHSLGSDENKSFIAELAELSGTQPQYDLKKALEPVSILVIATGAFIIGGIAQGFLKKIGEDIYSKLRDKLVDYYGSKKLPDQILDFSFIVEKNAKRFEVNVFLDNPSSEMVKEFFNSGISDIDRVLSMLPENLENSVSKIVLAYDGKEISLRYALRNDAVPMGFRLRSKK